MNEPEKFEGYTLYSTITDAQWAEAQAVFSRCLRRVNDAMIDLGRAFRKIMDDDKFMEAARALAKFSVEAEKVERQRDTSRRQKRRHHKQNHKPWEFR